MSLAYANKGRRFEELVGYQNDRYRQMGLAVVHKVPTAWTPIRGKKGKITGAFVSQKASVDFLGVWKDRAIAFDVKENSQPRWALDARFGHQLQFIRDWYMVGGVSFLLLNQSGTTYLLPARVLIDAWERAQSGGRKSLSLAEIIACPVVFETERGPVDYLAVLDVV